MKVAFIYSFEQSAWKSCQSITQNLIETYKLIYSAKDLLHFNYHEGQSSFKILELATHIIEESPDRLVIVDHKPHLEPLLKIFDVLLAKKKRPEIIFHVFGDFTLYGDKWLKIEPVLKKFNVKFICASDRQTELVNKFLVKKEALRLPFPVDQKSFYFSQALRKKKRKDLGLTDKIVYLYTGRLSLQKRISELCLDFVKFFEGRPESWVLYLAGEFDDLGSPFTGIYFRNGEFYQRYLRLMNTLPEAQRDRIRLLGNQDQSQLLELYNAADFFVSLSTHNDEDYGMSPAEALCTGLPAILSDWGGYSSFKSEEVASCSLVPVSVNKGLAQVQYDKDGLFSALEESLNLVGTHRKSRSDYSILHAKELSIAGNAGRLKTILSSPGAPFKGFSKLMRELAKAFKDKGAPFTVSKTKSVTTGDSSFMNVTTTITKKTELKPLYYKIYESYLPK